jgi:restriction system protein
MNNKMPTFDSMMNPLLDALDALGGSGSIAEIDEKVLELEKIDEEVASIPHDPEKSNKTEIAYRLAWTKTFLKKVGFLENSSRGVWALTPLAREKKHVVPREVVRKVNEDLAKAKEKKDKLKQIASEGSDADESIELDDSETAEDQEWREELFHVLTKKTEADAFERLAQRLLRESGFIQVEVLGRSGDGGIDGKGIARFYGFMSFHVYFQCKKFKDPVPASAMRDFRGAMAGRGEKGLFITTSRFTSSAVAEATRDGVPPIDLVDGELLAEKLKEYQLGIKTEMVEKVSVDEDWFTNL